MDRDRPTDGPSDRTRLGAVVLAAGAGSRFGGHKLAAELGGRPLLQHVLDTLEPVRPARTVVVLGPDSGGLERIAWRDATRIVNPDPARGLSSSLRLGLDACASDVSLDGAFILLGDQPLTAGTTLIALASAAPVAIGDGALAVVPDYACGGGANPVLLLRAGFPLVARLVGDRGLVSVLAERPDLVHRVSLPGWNPDVDTVADLRALEAGS
jgi:molybdenum cofactor cytidylyltransferase